jgi:hypothetical protein
MKVTNPAIISILLFFMATHLNAALPPIDLTLKNGESPTIQLKITMDKGLHPLQTNYLASPNAPALSLEWHGPGADMRAVPNTRLLIIMNARYNELKQ